MKKILIGCERSGVVRRSFAKAGWYAVSCDLVPTELPCGKNEDHYIGDVRDLLNDTWDLGIMHPDCTFLTCSAEWAYKDGPYHMKVKPGTLVGAARRQARQEAADFACELFFSKIKRVCVENPRGYLSQRLGTPQYVQPYYFGDDASKLTGLHLKNLPRLKIPAKEKWFPPRIVNGKERWANQTDSGQNKLPPSDSRAMDRAKTYQGIADAFVINWSML